MMKSVKSNYKASELELNNRSNRSDMPANIEINNNLQTHPEEQPQKLKPIEKKKKVIQEPIVEDQEIDDLNNQIELE
jgi:hypothetical protein